MLLSKKKNLLLYFLMEDIKAKQTCDFNFFFAYLICGYD